jgi:hypothetical protein
MEDLAKESDRPVMADRSHSYPPVFPSPNMPSGVQRRTRIKYIRVEPVPSDRRTELAASDEAATSVEGYRLRRRTNNHAGGL